MDWEQIRTDYITGDDSYRQLAEKYGVSLSDVGSHGAQEGWVPQRKQYRDKVRTKTMEKIANREAGQAAKRAAKVDTLADKLLVKLEQAIDELDLKVTTHKIKTETGNTEETMEYKVASEGGVVDRAGLRQLTAALKELKEIKGDKSELDRQEQEARIANLRRQAERDSDGPASITVQLGGLEEYAK